jgi:asparagine synthase (glutamine-hydrolysing)
MKKTLLASEIPLTSTSEIGRMLVEKTAAREKVKVLLDGCGGDEMLAGYPGRYFNVYLNQIIRGGDIPRFEREFRKLFSGRLREFGITGKMHPEFYKSFLKTQSSGTKLSGFFPDETMNPVFFREHSQQASPAPRLLLNLQQALWSDTLNLGRECNPLGKILYRFPYLDHRVVDYVFSVPACYKIHNGWTKSLVRTAMTGILPNGVCWRKEKIGGMAPVSAWKDFLTRNRDSINDLLTGREFHSAAFLNQKAIVKRLDALFDTAVSPATTDISGLWRFANLELWLRENMR